MREGRKEYTYVHTYIHMYTTGVWQRDDGEGAGRKGEVGREGRERGWWGGKYTHVWKAFKMYRDVGMTVPKITETRCKDGSVQARQGMQTLHKWPYPYTFFFAWGILFQAMLWDDCGRELCAQKNDVGMELLLQSLYASSCLTLPSLCILYVVFGTAIPTYIFIHFWKMFFYLFVCFCLTIVRHKGGCSCKLYTFTSK